MQSEKGFPSSDQLKSYVAYKSRLKLAARAVLSADDGLVVIVAKRLDGSRWHLVWRYAGRLCKLCIRWGPSYPQNRGHTHHHQLFGPCLLWPNGWMDEDATWYGSRPRPRPHCIRRVPALRETAQQPPSFRPYLLWPRWPISATAELLFGIKVNFN